jgi:hypothetical protein
MTLLEELTAHKGGLILLKTELFWYGGRGWDGCPGRVCLLMDSALTYDGATATATAAVILVDPDGADGFGDAVACLLIDGRPRWVWIAPADVELL